MAKRTDSTTPWMPPPPGKKPSSGGKKKAAPDPIPIAPPKPPKSYPKPPSGGGEKRRESSAERDAKKRADQAERDLKKEKDRVRKIENRNAYTGAQDKLDSLRDQLKAKKAQRQVNDANIEATKQLVSGGLDKSRDSLLAGITRDFSTKRTQIQTAFDSALTDFQGDLRDNEKTEADASFANTANRARESGDAMTQALSQGAGESDILKSQLQALRNWSANQGDVARSFFDTRNSVNSGIADLNSSTKNTLLNTESQANADRRNTWESYFESMSNAFSEMAKADQNNYLLDEESKAIRDAMDSPKDLLDWLNSGKDASDYDSRKRKKRSTLSGNGSYRSPWAEEAARLASQSWETPESNEAAQFRGGAMSEGSLNASSIHALRAATGAGTTAKSKKPEGANLRRW